MVAVVSAGSLLAGCGQQEQGRDTETTGETTDAETTTEETTVGETIVEETTRRETTTAASDGEQVAEVEVEAAPPAQAVNPPPSNGDSHPSHGLMPSQELDVNETGQDITNPSVISPAVSIVFFPAGNGATYSCTGGPPFVFSDHPMGNCAFLQIGVPVGLICDVPTTITFMHDMYQFVADGSLCHSGLDVSGISAGAALPMQAHTYPPDTEYAPYPPAA